MAFSFRLGGLTRNNKEKIIKRVGNERQQPLYSKARGIWSSSIFAYCTISAISELWR